MIETRSDKVYVFFAVDGPKLFHYPTLILVSSKFEIDLRRSSTGSVVFVIPAASQEF